MATMKIDFEFAREDTPPWRAETSDVIFVTGPNVKDAAADFIRFWDNRHQALPKHFAKLYSFRVSLVDPQPLAANGSYRPAFCQVGSYKELELQELTGRWPY